MEVLSCLLIILIIIPLTFLEAWVVMLLWNWIAPIFWTAAPELTYWQAMGAMILLNIIGSFFKTTCCRK